MIDSFHNSSYNRHSILETEHGSQIQNRLASLVSSFPLTNSLPNSKMQSLQDDILSETDPCSNFGPFGISLAVIYFITFCFIGQHCIRNKRPALEKTFTSFLLINNVLRIIYFLGWGISNHDQCPTMIIEDGDRTWLSYFSNIPAHFYITAFSILVYKFSFVFHRIINISYSHRVVSSIMTMALIIANVVSYLVAFASMIQFSWFIDHKHSWVQTVSLNTLIVLSASLAVLLFLYGNALFFTIQSYLKQVRQQWNQTEGIVAVQCDVANDLRDAHQQLLNQQSMNQNNNNNNNNNRMYNQYQNPPYPLANQSNNYMNGEQPQHIQPGSKDVLNLSTDNSVDHQTNHQSNPNLTSASSDQLSSSSHPQSSQTSSHLNAQQSSSGGQQSSSNQLSSNGGHPRNQAPPAPPNNQRANQVLQSNIVQQYHTLRNQPQHQQLQFQQQQAYQNHTPRPQNGHQTLNFQRQSQNGKNQQQSSANQFATMLSQPSPYGNQANPQSSNFNHSNGLVSNSNGGGDFGNYSSALGSQDRASHGSSTNLQQAFLQNNSHSTSFRDSGSGFNTSLSPAHDQVTYLVDTSSNRSSGFSNDSPNYQSSQQFNFGPNHGRTPQHSAQKSQNDPRRLFQKNNQFAAGQNPYTFNSNGSNRLKQEQQQSLLASSGGNNNGNNNFGDSSNNYGSIDRDSGNFASDVHAPQITYSDALPSGDPNTNPDLSRLVQLQGNSYYKKQGLLPHDHTFNRTFANNPQSLSYNITPTSPNSQTNSQLPPKFSFTDNYMFRPFIVSLCSSLCFVIRVTLLIAMSSFNVQQRPDIILLYSCCSEIIPMVLMWFVFNDPSLDNSSDNTSGQILHHDPNHIPNFADEEEQFFGYEYGDYNGYNNGDNFENGGYGSESNSPHHHESQIEIGSQQRHQQQPQQHQPHSRPPHQNPQHPSPLQAVMDIPNDHNNEYDPHFFPHNQSKGSLSMASTTGESTGLPVGEETYSIQASGSNLLSIPNTTK